MAGLGDRRRATSQRMHGAARARADHAARLALPVRLLAAALAVSIVPAPARSQHRVLHPRVRPTRAVRAYDPGQPSPAGEPAFRRFSADNGLTGVPVFALAQDSTGFLWVGGVGGLFRYDGRAFLRWAPDSIRLTVGCITVSPRGEVVAVSAEPAVLRITPAGAERIAPPAGGWTRSAPSAAFDAAGRLWVSDARLHYRDPTDSAWHTLPPSALGGETIRFVRAAAGRRGVLVATDSGVWLADHSGAARKLWRGRDVVDVVSGTTQGILILQIGGRLLSLRHGVAREILARNATPYARAIAVTERDGTVWVALDRYLVSLRPGEPPDIFGPADQIESGGPLLVDREGSLWLGTFESLVQYPEPRTRSWAGQQGLPSAHVRFLGRSGRDVVAVTWQGTGFLHPTHGGWRASSVRLATVSRSCPLDDGSALVVGGPGVVRMRGSRILGAVAGPHVGILDCAPASDGGRWLATGRGLYDVEPPVARGPPRAGSHGRLRLTAVASPPPFATPALARVALDRWGRLWVSVRDSVCDAPERALLHGARVAWSCTRLPRGTVELSGLLALPDGELWASSARNGVLRRVHGGWEPLPGSADLPTESVLALVPARSGGVWVVGNGFAWRVLPRHDRSGHWVVAERLTAWAGVLASGVSDLLEDPDGDVWLATARGVVHVPAAVRRSRPSPPPVVLEEARTDGQPVALSRPITLASGQHRLDLRFAALSFRDPIRLRYEVRLARHGAWATVHGAPSFRWLGLPSGTYHAQVRASLDGAEWSSPVATLAFRVVPPWYREPLAVGGEVVVLIAILWAAYRARVAYLLGLERQRTRIAMDLHDEVGSGLASVGILSGVLAADGLSAAEARGAAGEIARTAEELGDSLSDIVWSLQSGSARLADLAARLSEQGGRLFADGDTRFRADLPTSWPDGALPLPVLRTVLLVGLEALHNAAKHARARHVTLALRDDGDAWVLEVSDDGVGRPRDASSRRRAGRRGGHGLPGMRRRAEEIGADLEIAPGPDAGTTVRLRFGVGHLAWRQPAWRNRVLRRLRARLGASTRMNMRG